MRLVFSDTGTEFPELREFAGRYAEWLKERFPEREIVFVKMDFLKKSSLNLIEFAKLMIDENYYVTNTLDDYYIDTSFHYNQKHF